MTTTPVRSRKDVPHYDGAMTGCHRCHAPLVLTRVYVPMGGVFDVVDPRASYAGTWNHTTFEDRMACDIPDPYGRD